MIGAAVRRRVIAFVQSDPRPACPATLPLQRRLPFNRVADLEEHCQSLALSRLSTAKALSRRERTTCAGAFTKAHNRFDRPVALGRRRIEPFRRETSVYGADFAPVRTTIRGRRTEPRPRRGRSRTTESCPPAHYCTGCTTTSPVASMDTRCCIGRGGQSVGPSAVLRVPSFLGASEERYRAVPRFPLQDSCCTLSRGAVEPRKG